MQDAETWVSNNQQRVLFKGFTYKDVVVEISEEGLRLTSESRPKYLDRLIPWDSITQMESKFCNRQYFIQEYWSWLMKLKEYTGLLPYHKFMIALTYDDRAMMENNVHAWLNLDEQTYRAIKTFLGDPDGEATAEGPQSGTGGRYAS